MTSKASTAPSVRPTGVVDGDWELITFRAVRAEFSDDFGGTARIKYNGADANARNNFTVKLYKGNKPVAALHGPLASIAPGQTETVSFISDDKYQPGPYRIEFAKDL